jgi:hypothetical protein
MGDEFVAAKKYVLFALFWCETDKLHFIVPPLAPLVDLKSGAELILDPKRLVALVFTRYRYDMVHGSIFLKIW